ncbi:hypothetical protein NLJ89_g2287 [Agrocybe chaxingu]|uniref:Beta-glucuronidase C-terminal domain-containing protein n=1 Tax=Agrocybe chaxingu TaxID=84603 RepID=A0A9W8K7R4_9AGAR|nr:hypothetical protein NLJ89_g2287 [Agrocybe chaxingu]
MARVINLCVFAIKFSVASALSFLKLQGPPSLPPDASHRLHPSLASFSIETAFFEEFFGNLSAPNQLSLDLLENLHARTGVPAEVRIGGITADSTYWRPNQTVSLVNFIDNAGALHNTTVGPDFWKSMTLLPKGTKIMMNLNLQDLDYQGTLAMARATFESLSPDQFDGFETTLNLKTPQFQVGATVEDPLWPYNTPAANRQLSCVSALAAGANSGGVVKSCSEHTYQYSVCDPPRIAVATLPNLVNHTRLARYSSALRFCYYRLMWPELRFLDLWQPRIRAVREILGNDKFVIGEYNSVSCSGKDGVSNTFGQALWLLDTTLYGASLNISRMYLHHGGPLALQSRTQLNHGGLSFYDMWFPVQNLNGPIQVFPAYSTYLFITEALGFSRNLRIANLYPGRQANGSSITTELGDTSAGQLVAYGFWDEDAPTSRSFPTKLALLNLEIFNQTNTGARPSSQFDISAFRRDEKRPVRIRRLQAPGADVKGGNVTTWAGQIFSTGKATGDLVEETQRESTISLQASEAALVFL